MSLATSPTDEEIHAAISSPARDTWRMFRRNTAAVTGLVVFLVIVVATLIGPYLYRVDPFA
ncbi:MAG: hypothetical protein ACREFP_11190, partial [Acetobacteraceae bacterium]